MQARLATMHVLAAIPSPSTNGFHIGPLFLHFYGLCYVVAITACVMLFRRLWRERGGDPDIAYSVALWCVPAGILGARLYHDVTSWNTVPHNWWGWIAVWEGGLGIWGGIVGGFLGALVPMRRAGVNVRQFMDVTAPGLLLAQGIGRVGNYFNQELFGKPTNLPWALEISAAHRPAGYMGYSTFNPTFLYELIWDLSLAALLVWLIHHRRIKAPGIFALYVSGYSAFRLFEEQLRIDPSHYFLGERLNFWVALVIAIAGLVWFIAIQRGSGNADREPAEGRSAEPATAPVRGRPPAEPRRGRA